MSDHGAKLEDAGAPKFGRKDACFLEWPQGEPIWKTEGRCKRKPLRRYYLNEAETAGAVTSPALLLASIPLT